MISNLERLITFKGSRGDLERLITFTLLDYEHQFIGSLHIVDSRSWTQVLVFCCNIHKILQYNLLSMEECKINFKIRLRGSQYL